MVKQLNKYDLAVLYMEMVSECDGFLNQLPQSIESAFYDNEANRAKEDFIHVLLKQLLTESEYDDLTYFAYETNPRVEVDDQVFTNLEDYWTHLDQQATVNFVGNKL